jgi:hypothetical protein
MGKRELVIALVFIALGIVAYQMTAPPSQTGNRGISFTRFWENARRGMRSNAAQARTTSTGVVPVSTELTELRIEGLLTGRLRVIGEARTDIAYELAVESTGPDPDTALTYAKRVVVKKDDLGSTLTLRLDYPREFRQSAFVTVHVPSRLGVLASNASGLDVSNVGALHFDGVAGDATVANIAGAVDGTHRNGSLEVTGAGSVKVTLQRSRATLARVAGAVTLDAREGEARLTDVKGPIEIDETRAEIVIAQSGGTVRVGGSEGQVRLIDPAAEAKIDVRRTEVEVQVSAAVPLTLLTTNETLRLVLSGPPPVSLDAAATQGRIDAGDFGLQAETIDQDSRLTHNFGGAGAPRVSLRNSRGELLIKNLRGPIVNPDRK